MRAILAAIAVLSATAFVPKVASSQTMPYSATVIGTQVKGTNLWNYTLKNTSSSSSYTVILVQLEVDDTTRILKAPDLTNWASDVDPSCPFFVNWGSKDEGLKAGDSVSSFTVEFSKKPEFQNWTAMFNNIDDPGECPYDGGVVINAPVPEPAGLASLAVGLISLFGVTKRRRA